MVCLKFSKDERLTRSKDIQRVYREGKRYQTQGMVMQVCSNSLEKTRVVFSASKKVGTAVRRNRARRICSEVWRTLYKPWITKWVDIVFIIQPCQEETFEERKKQMQILLKKAGLVL
ncbi:MAG TPA: ribonuclease P protein component [Spirochaetales bacterium]|nr:ribonuclease P protein component [Spirochaetales bacterium]HOT58204.1 ribonuclease P protein component [Spirochaetales bacterium]HPD81105.1 ribonuclease P protein component [Spirochaetales bacterium]HQK34035.1 ribonuclease P protein component [Spirochaetales bacterium]